MRPLLAMIKANLKMSVRNRQALFWNLAFPAIFIVLFGTIFNEGGNVSFDVGVAGGGDDGSASALQSGLVSAMEANGAFKVHQGAAATELRKLKDGDRDVVVTFGPPAVAGGQPTVQLAYDGTSGPTADVAINVVRQLILQVSQPEAPVRITEQTVASNRISYIDFLVPGVLAMSIMNAGVIGLSTAFVTYRERGILRRIKVTPFPLPNFILARILSQLIIAVLQSVILVGLGMALFGLTIEGNLLQALLVIVCGSLAFLAIGFAVSSFAKNAETAASYANLITFPMLFLSGVFFTLDSAPSWLQPLTRVLPLRYLVDALRGTMSKGQGLGQIWLDLVVLLATAAVAFAIAVRFFRWDARAA